MVKKHKCHLLFLALITMLSITGCYAWINDGYEVESGTDINVYTINSSTILDSLNRGDTNVFKLQKATPAATVPSPDGAVVWSQVDFLQIAQALHEHSSKEALNEQNIYSMSFIMDCTEVDRRTFREAEFLSFQVIKNGAEETRVQYRTRILPFENRIYTSKAEYHPNIKTKEPINLARYRISVEEALKIAENNGGAEKRLVLKNDCRISALAPGPDAKGWRVLYQNNQNQWWSLFFEIAIDPQSGLFNILTDK